MSSIDEADLAIHWRQTFSLRSEVGTYSTTFPPLIPYKSPSYGKDILFLFLRFPAPFKHNPIVLKSTLYSLRLVSHS